MTIGAILMPVCLILTYQDVISKELSVMDVTAITLCQENNIPGISIALGLGTVVFNLNKLGNTPEAIRGKSVGTLTGVT
ncbi:hypothetical protein OROMI_017137 [Orobanche minor]